MKAIPEIGKYYHFWDYGKSSPSRHYICRVERILTPEEAKSIKVMAPEWHYDNKTIGYVETTLYDHWEYNKLSHDWLYAEDTDYFIEASCPKYDEHNLWFVRTKGGGWFSMDIQSSWQGGELDVDGSIYKYNTKYYQEFSKCTDEELLQYYPKAIKDNWRS